MNLLQGDCLEVLRALEADSVDSLVTDPPAGIGFMGKDWDHHKGGREEWVAWLASVMRECYRVMKPGAHGLVWAIPRTSHWTATALEDAGFEVRDCITHLFGSGFPKSLDISKAIDKAAGLNRPRIPGGQGGKNNVLGARKPGEAISGEAIKWNGWGTALKPAAEFWWLVRKPISEKTVAANVLKWGTGGMNIDAGRIPAGDEKIASPLKVSTNKHEGYKRPWNDDPAGRARADAQKIFAAEKAQSIGRFPANLVLSHSPYCTDEMCDIECAVAMLDAQSGIRPTSKPGMVKRNAATNPNSMAGSHGVLDRAEVAYGDSGGASRFFYCAKISTSERNAGLEALPSRKVATSNGAKAALARGEEYAGDSSGFEKIRETKNTHPTVKPKKLMGYLIKLITPPQGVVLDPFMGSGSTGIAAKENDFQFIGIEREVEYFEIAKARVHA